MHITNNLNIHQVEFENPDIEFEDELNIIDESEENTDEISDKNSKKVRKAVRQVHKKRRPSDKGSLKHLNDDINPEKLMRKRADIKNEKRDYLNNNTGKWKFSKNLNIFDNAHAVLVLTEWDDYKNIEWDNVAKKMVKPAWVFDARSIINVDLVEKSGLNLWCLGDGGSKDKAGYF